MYRHQALSASILPHAVLLLSHLFAFGPQACCAGSQELFSVPASVISLASPGLREKLGCLDVVGIAVEKTEETQANSSYFSLYLQDKFLKYLQRLVTDFNRKFHTEE